MRPGNEVPRGVDPVAVDDIRSPDGTWRVGFMVRLIGCLRLTNERGSTAPSELRRTWQRSSCHVSTWKPGDQRFSELRTWTCVPGVRARAGEGDRRGGAASIGVSLGRADHGRGGEAPLTLDPPSRGQAGSFAARPSNGRAAITGRSAVGSYAS